MINETPVGKLKTYLIGDLGVARRHLARIRDGVLVPSSAVLCEIQRSIEDCVARIERDVKDKPEPPEPPERKIGKFIGIGAGWRRNTLMIHCPHCERELRVGHRCPPSRRWFMFGMLAAPAITLAKSTPAGVRFFLRGPVVDGGPLTREDFERAMDALRAMWESPDGGFTLRPIRPETMTETKLLIDAGWHWDQHKREFTP